MYGRTKQSKGKKGIRVFVSKMAKDKLYFLGYFRCIKQESVEGIPIKDVVSMSGDDKDMDTQHLSWFREMTYFQITLELIPDSILDCLPVREDTGCRRLVHYGGPLKEVMVQYDNYEKIRMDVECKHVNNLLSLGCCVMKTTQQPRKETQRRRMLTLSLLQENI